MRSFEFSHRSSPSARANRRRLLAATVLAIVLIALDTVSGGSVRSLVRSVSSSLWLSTENVRATITESGYFTAHRSLARENAALRAQLAQYDEKAASYDALVSENAQLRAALNFSAGASTITAPVVSSFRSSPYGTFMIAAGERDLIRAGSPVLSHTGFVLGVVSDVQSKSTMVKSLLASGEYVDVLIGETPVTLLGDGGGNGHASLPRGITISEGSSVTAPAFGGRPIGVVGKVDAPPASPDQTIYVHLPFNLASMRFVYVVRE